MAPLSSLAMPASGLLIIRAWVEEESAEPLRAHIRMTGDVSKGIERTLTLTQSGAVCELTDTWLQSILKASDPEHRRST